MSLIDLNAMKCKHYTVHSMSDCLYVVRTIPCVFNNCLIQMVATRSATCSSVKITVALLFIPFVFVDQ